VNGRRGFHKGKALDAILSAGCSLTAFARLVMVDLEDLVLLRLAEPEVAQPFASLHRLCERGPGEREGQGAPD